MILLTIFLLILLEVSLSFDNAIINAAVLKDMPVKWQKRFITFGMPIAVFGMRLVFPVVIVALAGGLGLGTVLDLAIHNPSEYAAQLTKSHISIASFGGIFLLMVFLNFILNPGGEREILWLTWIEKKLQAVGLLKGVEIVIALIVLVIVSNLVEPTEKITCLTSGIVGLVLYVLMDAITGLSELGEKSKVCAGLSGFLYLEVLDASCSLDGVIGAFVLTNNILVIMIGLGVGAFVIRSLTLYFVRGGVLQEYIYLEHGAHYGIGALAIIMLVDTFYPVPEPVTGTMGVAFIIAALISSIRNNRKTLVKN